MAMNDKQYMAARLAELRDISKRIKHIESMVEDILEIFKMNTYGETNSGVQLTIDDICRKIVENKETKDD